MRKREQAVELKRARAESQRVYEEQMKRERRS